VQKLYYMLTKT